MRQTRETKKSNNQLSNPACCRRHQLLTKRQRNPCVLSVSATSRVRVARAAIALPRSVPVYAKAPTTVVAQPHDGNFQPSVNFCPKDGVSIRLNQRTTTSIPVYGNLSRQCPNDNSTRLDTDKQGDTCTHRDVHRPTERLRQRHNQRDMERDAETFQLGCALGKIYDVDNHIQ